MVVDHVPFFSRVYKRSMFVKLYVTMMYQCVYGNLISIMLRIVYLAEPPYGIIYVCWYGSPTRWNVPNHVISNVLKKTKLFSFNTSTVTFFLAVSNLLPPRVAGSAVTSFPVKSLNCHISRSRDTRIPLLTCTQSRSSLTHSIHQKSRDFIQGNFAYLARICASLILPRPRGEEGNCSYLLPLSHRDYVAKKWSPAGLWYLGSAVALLHFLSHRLPGDRKFRALLYWAELATTAPNIWTIVLCSWQVGVQAAKIWINSRYWRTVINQHRHPHVKDKTVSRQS